MKRELALLLCVFAGISSAPVSADENAGRRADVERQSELVMPFSMELTKHIFTPAADGGTQAVLVTDGDRTQVELVRSHLQAESVKFARGDYSDPLAIHGAAMPGLATLQTSRGKIAVRYADVPGGGKIVFASQNARMIGALHAWFAAQVSDHGSHAAMKM